MPVQSYSFKPPLTLFRPNQCPNCKNNNPEQKSCDAFIETVPLPFGTSKLIMRPVFKGESNDACPNYLAK